jgi:hypothetical protein
VTEGDLHIEQRNLEPGRPVVIWPGSRTLYAAYDPGQITESCAVAAIRLLVPDVPERLEVIRSGHSPRESESRILQSMDAVGGQEFPA